MSEQDGLRAPFDHPKNIQVGDGRILYATRHGVLPEGWVLPGGLRTQDSRRAHEAALYIDSVTPKKNATPPGALGGIELGKP